MDQLAGLDAPPDLSLCEQEPIHIPGAIQPFGALLATCADGDRVTHASANLEAILGRAPDAVLGRTLEQAVGQAACHALLKAGTDPGPPCVVPAPDRPALHFQAHRSGAHICIDIQPLYRAPWQKPPYTLAQSVLESFNDARTRTELCARAVVGLRTITGYDRVMAYRFAADGHGEVIAEARADELPPYLGLRYPATDIPPQARRQYLRQRVGLIADSDYQPVPLCLDPARDTGTPLDLSRSALRSVSALHRAYMRNMGTAASLTVGLAGQPPLPGQAVSAPDLWGMLVCHHQTPRIAEPELRAVAGLIGQVVSLLLTNLGAAETYAHRLGRAATLGRLTERLASPAQPIDSLVAMEADLLRLVDAGGVAIRFADSVVCLGATPAPGLIPRVMAVLGTGGGAAAVDDLGLRYPELVACTADGSGALLLPLGTVAGDAIMWFRPEHARMVRWGGNPADHGMRDPDTGQPSPRTSFAAWQEVVVGRSAPWTEADVLLAGDLRRVIDAEALRRTRAARHLFDVVFESSPAALVLTNLAGGIKTVNQPAARLFGYARAELDGKPFGALLPERFRGRYFDPGGNGSAGSAATVDLAGLRKDGSEFPLDIELTRVSPAGAGGVPMIQARIADMTLPRAMEHEKLLFEQDRRMKRRELERSNADLEEFAYAVSHDLKAPLRAIGHLAQWIGEDIGPAAKPETLENLTLLQGRVVRMQKLLEGLLGYSLLVRTDRAVESIDIEDVVRDIVAMLAPPPGFSVVCAPPMTPIRTERAAIQMVLENLIGNGLKHHDRTSGKVVVSMRMTGSLAEIRVSDDGPGIAEQFHQRIFTIFQTLRSRDEFEASGIGLAIVKRKVETHGGEIWVESAAPLRGACFVFTWEETPP